MPIQLNEFFPLFSDRETGRLSIRKILGIPILSYLTWQANSQFIKLMGLFSLTVNQPFSFFRWSLSGFYCNFRSKHESNTPHYHLDYSSAHNEDELVRDLQNSSYTKARIIEVKTNPDSDVDLFTSFKNLSIL